MNTYRILGMMSGTSLDGLDLIEVVFKYNPSEESAWQYEITAATTFPYSDTWQNRLSKAPLLSGLELSLLDVDYGHFIGDCIRHFIQSHHLRPQAIAIHGHTVFHQPQHRLSLQIGSAAAVAAETSLPVISKFRDKDVALGGQGAPLVPIGDHYLFAPYTYCLNLGGVANISYCEPKTSQRKAFDVCMCNMVLNTLSSLLGQPYDPQGSLAAKGKRIEPLLNELNALDFYHLSGPKSLGREWYEKNIEKVNQKYLDQNFPVEDLLHTHVHHIALQIGFQCPWPGTMMITGGGAFNQFLVKQIQKVCSTVQIIPANPNLINYKEALIFAFLGALRLSEQCNCLASVTGSQTDHIGGSVFI